MFENNHKDCCNNVKFHNCNRVQNTNITCNLLRNEKNNSFCVSILLHQDAKFDRSMNGKKILYIRLATNFLRHDLEFF